MWENPFGIGYFSKKNSRVFTQRKMEHQKPMQKEIPDAYLSEKEKFLKKNKDNMIDKGVRKDE
ncbi:unnamed protein product [marine sediment metagenome]|uniref:Uncharacterized protein n=1 Tax=marine sediment metagenome TaxID=412755 RepID=X0SVP1_9ZZZZ